MPDFAWAVAEQGHCSSSKPPTQVGVLLAILQVAGDDGVCCSVAPLAVGCLSSLCTRPEVWPVETWKRPAERSWEFARRGSVVLAMSALRLSGLRLLVLGGFEPGKQLVSDSEETRAPLPAAKNPCAHDAQGVAFA